MSDPKLVALSKRINAALDRVDEERAAVKDIFAEAKSAGYIPKILRKAITRQRMDASKRQEEDSILDLYDHALGTLGEALQAVSGGATWDEAVKATGVPRATLARAAAVSKRREVIPENATTSDTVAGDDTRTPVPEGRSAEVVANPSSGGDADAGTNAGIPHDEPAPGPLDTHSDDLETMDDAQRAECIARVSDDLAIPPGLDRRRRAA